MATHWGFYWKIKKKHTTRTLCSSLLSIDSYKLMKETIFSGFSVQPLDIKAKLVDNELQITYRNHKKHAYTIQISKVPCHLGGYRTYFICPLCTSRKRKLYLTDKSVFLCRTCLNLTYATQLLRPTRRCDFMSDKIKNIIIDQGGDLESKKPKGMFKAEYERLKLTQKYYEQSSHKELNAELRKWYGESMEKHLDRHFDYAPPKPLSLRKQKLNAYNSERS